jgi:heat shock protein HslJ
MKLIQIFSVILFLSLTFTACSSVSNNSDGNTSLFGTGWVLTKIEGQAVAKPLGGNVATLTLIYRDSTFSGNGSCNQYFGNFETSGNTIKFKELGSTKMMCDDMNIEINFFNAIKKSTSFEIKDDTLLLYSGGKIILEFVANSPK